MAGPSPRPGRDRLDHGFVGHDPAGGALGQHRALHHHDHRVAEPGDELHVVLDHAEGIAALAVEPPNRVADDAQERAVDAGADLVQQHDAGIDHHRAAKLQQLLLAAREVARQLVGNAAEAEEVDHIIGPLPVRALLLPHRSRLQPGSEKPLPGLSRRHGHQVLAHGQCRELMRDLEGPEQAPVEQLVGLEAGDVLTAEKDLPRVGREHAGNQVEQRRLAGAVGADQACDRALCDLQTRAVNGCHAAEALGDPGDADHRSSAALRREGRAAGIGAAPPAPGQRYRTVVILPPSIAISR